jgi:four helix bundle protein
MENKKDYILLKDLEVYQLARELSRIGWEIYQSLDWKIQKINGDQFIESTDSTGANVAEGYGRYHYLDRIKFYYNARGSFLECNEHWIELLKERGKVSVELYNKYKETAIKFSKKLNNFISSTYQSKSGDSK